MNIDQPADHRIQMIGDHLKQIRLKKGYTSYVEFALEAQIQPKQYWKLEAGNANFTIRTLLRVLDALDMSLEEFFKGMKCHSENNTQPNAG